MMVGRGTASMGCDDAVCVVHTGAVIVGTVQGGRIWGKELKGLALTHVQWSPDSKVILFGHSKGEVQIYDSHGTYNVSPRPHYHTDSTPFFCSPSWWCSVCLE